MITGNILIISCKMSFVILIEVLIAIAVTVVVYLKWSYQYWKRKNVPYLEPTMPFGNMQNPINHKMSFGQLINEYYKIGKAREWRYFGIYSMVTPFLFITDLELLKMILTKDFNHFVDRGNYVNEKDDPLSAHLFAIGGVKWRNLRAKLTPTFTSGKMRGMFHTLLECGFMLDKYIEKKLEKDDSIEMKSLLGDFSTDIIGSCAFGIECKSFENPGSLFRVYGKKVFLPNKLTHFSRFISTNFPKLSLAIGLTIFDQNINTFFIDLVKDTISYRQKNNVRRNDFLQLLMDLLVKDDESNNKHYGDGKSLTLNEVAAQSFVFFVAGFETSSTTMSFALFELTRHPDIQTKVREEILEVLKRHNNQITYDSLNEMTYLRQVIDETLRKYPPLPLVTRCCVQDWRIPNSDVVIEKGTKVMIPIIGVHLDPNNHENPEDFDPERFSEENEKNIHPYAHIPFGEGPRICIGLRFGIMQTKVGLVTILRKYRVSLSNKTKVPLKYSVDSLFTSAEGGLWMNLEKIHK